MKLVLRAVALVCISTLFNSCSQKDSPKGLEGARKTVLTAKKFQKLFEPVRTIELITDAEHPIGTMNSVLFMRNENIIVADNAAHQLLLFDSTGKIIKQVGRYGEGPGEYRRIVGLGSTHANHILVYDNKLDRVTEFGQGGEYIVSFSVMYGFAFAVAPNDGFYVYDVLSPPGGNAKVVEKYSFDGSKRTAFASQVKTAFVDGVPIGGGGIACSSDGNVFVIHASDYRVKKFNSVGDSLLEFGNPPSYYKRLDSPFTYSDTSKLNAFTAASSIAIADEDIVLLSFVRKRPATVWLELYDVDGNFLAGTIELPAGLSSLKAVSNETIYFAQALGDRIDDTGTLPNPRLLGYKLKKDRP